MNTKKLLFVLGSSIFLLISSIVIFGEDFFLLGNGEVVLDEHYELEEKPHVIIQTEERFAEIDENLYEIEKKYGQDAVEDLFNKYIELEGKFFEISQDYMERVISDEELNEYLEVINSEIDNLVNEINAYKVE